MTHNRQRPTLILGILLWFIFGGLQAASLGSQIAGLASVPFLGEAISWLSDMVLGLPAGATTAIGWLLLIGGVLMLPIAYLIDKADERGLQWGVPVAVIVGICQFVPALLIAFKLSYFGGPILGSLLAGGLSLAVAYALAKRPEAHEWFHPYYAPPPPPPSPQPRPGPRPVPMPPTPSPDPTRLQPMAKPSGWLVSRLSGGAQPVALRDWTKLGRNPDCSIQLHTQAAGREHAVISFENGHYYISDMNSKAGTFVGNQRIMAKRQLFPNDEVRMGDDIFVFLQAPPDRP